MKRPGRSVRALGVLGIAACWTGVCLAQPVRTLEVNSTPIAGVVVGASPADLNGATGAQTGFTRQYTNGTVVSLTTPSVNGAHTFVKWQRNGVDFSDNPVGTHPHRATSPWQLPQCLGPAFRPGRLPVLGDRR